MVNFTLRTSQKIYLPFKRFLDIVFSIVFIIVLSPLFLLIALGVVLTSRGHAIFRQNRAGKNRITFNILKFRTMYDKKTIDPQTKQISVIRTYSKFGKFLRRTSLDELPQLFNILFGQMSFVGPRPLIWYEIDVINERDKFGANQLKPGLTGYAQINGREKIPGIEKAKYDGIYFQKMSFLFDMKIIFLTFKVIFNHN
jgi:O-antigen biosynthesis protein WbqP